MNTLQKITFNLQNIVAKGYNIFSFFNKKKMIFKTPNKTKQKMQRQEKIKDCVIETVNIPPSKPLFGHALAHKTLILSSCQFKVAENSAMHMNGKTSRLRINFIDHGVKVCTHIVEQVSLSFLCCALLMCIPEFKMGTTK